LFPIVGRREKRETVVDVFVLTLKLELELSPGETEEEKNKSYFNPFRHIGDF